MSNKHQETTTLESETSPNTEIAGASNVAGQESPGSRFLLNQREIRLVVIGRTGEGKSSTCNSILGEKRFKPSTGFRLGSKVTQYTTKEIDGHELSIVDTPGICNTYYEQHEILLEMVKCLVLSSPGPHAFLLVISVPRYTNEAREAVAILRKYFGANLLSNTIIVFTRKDELDDDVTALTKALDQAPEDLRYLIEECGGRYVWFNNKAKEEENKRQVSCLLQIVMELKRTGFFSSEIYDKVESELNKELYIEASKKLKARSEELEQLQETIGKQKRDMEYLNCYPSQPKDKATLKQLISANTRLFDERKIAMYTFIIGLRETMRMSISESGKEIAIAAAFGGVLGSILGLRMGAAIGAHIGAVKKGFSPVGAVIGGFSYGLVVYLRQRNAEERIKQIKTEVYEVLHRTCLIKPHESEPETRDQRKLDCAGTVHQFE